MSFLRSNKRKAETNEATFDPQPKPKRVKEAAKAVPEAQAQKKPEPEKRGTSKKKNVVQHLSTSKGAHDVSVCPRPLVSPNINLSAGHRPVVSMDDETKPC